MPTIYGTPVTFGGSEGGAEISVTYNEDGTQNLLLSDNRNANLDTNMPIASVSYNGVAVPLVGGVEDNKLPGFTYTGEYEMSDAFNYGLTGDYEVLVLKTSGILTFDRSVNADVFMVGGGGGGSRGNSNGRYSSGGGGGGYTATYASQAIGSAPIDVVIGEGGAGAVSNAQGGAGGTTSFGPLSVSGATQATREAGIVVSPIYCGGNGGSGGGGGTPTEEACSTNVGGSDGSDGGCYTSVYPGGKGQGTTTRAFGESGAKLFAGGGGGGNHSATSTPGGAGGGGLGGGNAAAEGPTAGEPNTGGGGGGASDFFNRGADGGSGVVLIRLAQTA